MVKLCAEHTYLANHYRNWRGKKSSMYKGVEKIPSNIWAVIYKKGRVGTYSSEEQAHKVYHKCEDEDLKKEKEKLDKWEGSVFWWKLGGDPYGYHQGYNDHV